MDKKVKILIDILVPFGILLRNSDDLRPFDRWSEVLLRFLPHTFFVYWLFTFIPIAGGLLYMMILVPLSFRLNSKTADRGNKQRIASGLLVYYTVILIGFGSIWSFIGHTLLADYVAAQIGWQTGSPFQTELSFYTLGTGIAALLAIWIRDHLITALVISKSVFWYGATYVHIHDAITTQNFSPLNVGAHLLGDLVYPTLLLTLLVKANRTA